MNFDLSTDEDKIVGSIKAISPILASAIGGPLASCAISFLATAIGSQEKPVPKDGLVNLLSLMNPETILAVKRAELDFQKFTMENDLEENQNMYEDMHDAREMASKLTVKPQIVMSIIFVIGYFATLITVMVMMTNMPKDSNPFILGVFSTLLGVLTTAVPQILSFWFGSNKSEQERNISGISLQSDLQKLLKDKTNQLSNSIPIASMGSVVNAMNAANQVSSVVQTITPAVPEGFARSAEASGPEGEAISAANDVALGIK